MYSTLGGPTEPSLAMECAADRGAFEEFHNATHEALEEGRGAVAWLAGRQAIAGPDSAAFDACVSSRRFSEKLDRQDALAKGIGLIYTPTSFVNGRAVVGAADLRYLERIVRFELAARRPSGSP
jgi:protein-disulfide isomerase